MQSIIQQANEGNRLAQKILAYEANRRRFYQKLDNLNVHVVQERKFIPMKTKFNWSKFWSLFNPKHYLI